MPCECDRFDFDDGGVYQGDHEAGRAHGFGIFTAAPGAGRVEFAGAWKNGYELSGAFSWNNGRNHYSGQWSDGKRHGSGVEKRTDWIYRGEWSNGFKGRYGVRQSCANGAKYEGTWTSGLQDGYGVETYPDGGFYQGQWLRGLRHGYGSRISASYSNALAKHKSIAPKPALKTVQPKTSVNPFRLSAPITPDIDTILRERYHRIQFLAGGFVLVDSLPDPYDESKRGFHRMRLSLRDTLSTVKKPPKTGSTTDGTNVGGSASRETPKSTSRFFRQRPSLSALETAQPGRPVSITSVIQACCTKSSFVDLTGTGIEILDGTLVEKYHGEWKQDKRTGYGVCERSDGMKYEGEWANDRKHGYGITTLPNGRQLVGKYKNNVLTSSAGEIPSGTKKRFDFLIPSLRSGTIRERAESAAQMARTAAENAIQKAGTAVIRMATAKLKAEEADVKGNEAEKYEQSARFRVGEIKSFGSKTGATLSINRQHESNCLLDYEHAIPGQHDLMGPIYVAPKRFSLFKSKKRQLDAREREMLDRKFAADDDAMMQPNFDQFLRNENQLLGFSPSTPSTLDQSLQLSAGSDLAELDRLLALEAGSSFQTGNVFPEEVATVNSTQFASASNPSTSSQQQQQQEQQQQQQQQQQFSIRSRTNNRGSDRKSVASELCYHNRLDWVQRYDRRNSLPSIYKQKLIEAKPAQEAPASIAGSAGAGMGHMSPAPVKPQEKTETFVVVKGVRRRVQPLFEDASVGTRKIETVNKSGNGSAFGSLLVKTMQASFAVASSSSRAWSKTNPDDRVEKLYRIESPRMRRKGSTPDVSAIHESEVMPREQVYAMSQRKREERIKERAETDERRRQNEIVISFTNAKDWIALFVVIVNASLAAVFYNLLS